MIALFAHSVQRLLLLGMLWIFLGLPAAANSVIITGAGASFPYPLYAKWAAMYQEATGKKINYQSIGSGGGIKQIKAGTVDFGASRHALKREELDAAQLLQFPAIIGGVVPVVNLPGVAPGTLKLTGALLADIYLGKIQKWNDPRLTAINGGLTLPALDITVVYRSDSSGTSYVWSNYLSKIHPDFKHSIGTGSSLKWPVGIGAKGNEGIAANVQKMKGAIGYVEYVYAKTNHLSHAQLQNQGGIFVQPNQESFSAASSAADWKNTPAMAVDLTNAAGAKSWPVTSASFILLQKKSAPKTQEVQAFFSWAFDHGQVAAENLAYIPLPPAVTEFILTEWKSSK